jgi:serine/threonine protein kinase
VHVQGSTTSHRVHATVAVVVQADEIYKICSVIGTPTLQNWPEGVKLAAAMNFRFPQFSPTPLNKIITNASPEAIDLITALCSWDPAKRPTAVQCLQHPYFSVRACPTLRRRCQSFWAAAALHCTCVLLRLF